MNVIQNYYSIINNIDFVFKRMIEEKGDESLSKSHNFLMDYELFKHALAGRPEVAVLELALKEYQFALFALVSGQYRHAFGGLRLFFELMLSTVQFSAHEIDFRRWDKDEKDINWSSLISNETGVFSVNFIRAFNPDFTDSAKQYLAIAGTVYRECSQFVHGNSNTHKNLPNTFEFKKDIFEDWHIKAATMRLAVVFAFSARYLNYVENNTIEPVVLDTLGHLTAVQTIYSKFSMEK